MNNAERQKTYILIVDSNADDGVRTGSVIRKFGYNIALARSTSEALDFLTIAPPAGILCDAHVDNVNLLRLIKRYPPFSDVPLIMLTATPDPALTDLERRGEFAACLAKPVRIEKLYQAVQKFIEKGSRRNIRIATSIEAKAGGEGSEEGNVEGTIISLSEFGLFLVVRDLLPKNTRLPLRFEIKGREIRTEVVVLYAASRGEGPLREQGMGMKFVRIRPGDRALIKEFIIEQVHAGAPEKKRHLSK